MDKICKWWGHRLVPEAAEFYSVYICKRCGKYVEEDRGLREWLNLRWYFFLWNTRHKIADWRTWLRCPDCGLHFGKHDESQDHIPF